MRINVLALPQKNGPLPKRKARFHMSGDALVEGSCVAHHAIAVVVEVAFGG